MFYTCCTFACQLSQNNAYTPPAYTAFAMRDQFYMETLSYNPPYQRKPPHTPTVDGLSLRLPPATPWRQALARFTAERGSRR
jgi:hypothetical protein